MLRLFLILLFKTKEKSEEICFKLGRHVVFVVLPIYFKKVHNYFRCFYIRKSENLQCGVDVYRKIFCVVSILQYK